MPFLKKKKMFEVPQKIQWLVLMRTSCIYCTNIIENKIGFVKSTVIRSYPSQFVLI